jgi:hypothetical protein
MNGCEIHLGRTEVPCHMCLETVLGGLVGQFIHMAGEATTVEGKIEQERLIIVYHSDSPLTMSKDWSMRYIRFPKVESSLPITEQPRGESAK